MWLHRQFYKLLFSLLLSLPGWYITGYVRLMKMALNNI
jgi:hypothetical protein